MSAYRPSLDFKHVNQHDAGMWILGSLALVVLGAGSLQGQVAVAGRSSQATIVGMVTDSTGRPLAGAQIRLVADDSVLSLARSDEDGRFMAVGNVRRRSRLQVQRLGYRARDLELFFPRDSTRPLLIQLESVGRHAEGAPGGEPTGDDGSLREFHDRRQSNSLGHYFTRDEIVRRQPQFLSEVLRSVPGVTVSPSRTGGFVLRMRGCRYAPIVWVDRHRLAGTELDDIARVDDVAALEVYSGPTGVPPQYLDRSNVGCGTILVWTRVQ